MSSDIPHTPRPPFIALLDYAYDEFVQELARRVATTGTPTSGSPTDACSATSIPKAARA